MSTTTPMMRQYLTIKAEEPLSGRTYFEATIKNGAVKIVPATQSEINDWAAYQDSILALIDKFTIQVSNPTKKWVAKHIGDATARKQLSGFGKVVLSCR